MLNQINTNKKLLLFPTMFLVIVILSGMLYTYYSNIANERNSAAIKTERFIQDVLKGRISVYQFLTLPSEETAQKTREIFSEFDKEVLKFKNNLSSEKNRNLSDEIVSNSKKYIEYFDNFSKQKIENFKNGIKDDSDEIKNIISHMVNVGLVLEEKLNEINESAESLKEEANNSLNSLLVVIAISSILVFAIISLYISNIIVKSLNDFKEGLLSFFSYLNREASDTTLLEESNKDEFGQMAKVVNVNILKTKLGIEEDRKLIDETIAVLGEFEQGDLCKRLNIEVSNPALMQLKNVLNLMGEHLESNVNNVLDVLEQYSNHNYLNKIDQKGLKEHLLKLANGVNVLGNSITSMLVENKSNGLTLEQSSSLLLANVDKLNLSSNEAAASLEETAAALEEITSNIRNNTGNIARMAKYSNEITKASSEGEKLANSTTTAMDEINTQVNLVNEAISVIDQIAFQTIFFH